MEKRFEIENFNRSTVYETTYEKNLRRRKKLATFFGDHAYENANEMRYILEQKDKKKI